VRTQSINHAGICTLAITENISYGRLMIVLSRSRHDLCADNTSVLRPVVEASTHSICLPCGPMHLSQCKQLYHSWLISGYHHSSLNQTGAVLKYIIRPGLRLYALFMYVC